MTGSRGSSHLSALGTASNCGVSMAGMPSLGGPPDMISLKWHAVLCKIRLPLRVVKGNSLAPSPARGGHEGDHRHCRDYQDGRLHRAPFGGVPTMPCRVRRGYAPSDWIMRTEPCVFPPLDDLNPSYVGAGGENVAWPTSCLLAVWAIARPA